MIFPAHRHAKPLARLLLLPMVLALGACATTTIEKGVVVGKGERTVTSASPPISTYWVDVRGKNREGQQATERVMLFKSDWERFSKGDRIVPAEYELSDLGKSLRKTFRKVTKDRFAPKPTPPPQKPTPRPAKPKRSAPAKPKQPALATPRPAPAPEFQQVQEQAQESAEVREMKRKIHAATTPEDQARAWQEYRAALFQKMRAIAPSLSDRIDQAAAAEASR